MQTKNEGPRGGGDTKKMQDSFPDYVLNFWKSNSLIDMLFVFNSSIANSDETNKVSKSLKSHHNQNEKTS